MVNEDAESIHRVNTDSVQKLCNSSYSGEEITSWIARLHPSMYKPSIENGTLKVVVLENEVVACGCLEPPHSDKVATVCCLYVSPNMAGKGIGKLLLWFLENEAKVKGYKSVRLESSLNAEGFYKANGYHITQKDLLHYIGDHPVRASLMTKTL